MKDKELKEIMDRSYKSDIETTLKQILDLCRRQQRIHIEDETGESGKIMLKDLLDSGAIKMNHFVAFIEAVEHYDKPYTITLT